MAGCVDAVVARSVIDSAFQFASTKKPSQMVGKNRHGGQAIFNRFEKEMLVNVLLAVIEEFPQYATECPQMDQLIEPGNIHLLHFIAQGFMDALIIQHNVNNADKTVSSGPRIVPLSWEERLKILRAIIPLEFPAASKFWKTASYILSLPKCPKLVVVNVLQAVSEGSASFASMNFIMHETVFSTLIDDPSLIRIAALFGELQPSTVERFASKRKPDFRVRCREVIYEVENMVHSKQKWETALAKCALRSYNCKGFGCPLQYDMFCRNVRSLVKSLKGENRPDDIRINFGWARAAVKKSADRYYGDGSWKAENMHEVLWTICAQRPSMRKFVADMLSTKYNDPSEAQKWKTFNVPFYSRTKIKYPFETRMDPLAPNPPYLSFPECVKSITVVQNVQQLKVLEDLLDDCAIGDYPIVGLDAEWSSYVSYSKATIFQIAMRTQVFIIDLDAFNKDSLILSKFFEKLFLNDEIMKIGYHFGEDLVQLRHAVTRCGALYYPTNLICIDRLVEALKAESVKQWEVNLEGVFNPFPCANDKQATECEATPKENDGGAEEATNNESINEMNTLKEETNIGEETDGYMESLEDEMLQEADAVPTCQLLTEQADSGSSSTVNERSKANKARKAELQTPIRGLSALCECILGSALDKSEQCSVWDRRPLRCLQLRYAALDAYCMLMLYDKCAEWATRLNIDVNELCTHQDPVRVPLPLLWDD